MNHAKKLNSISKRHFGFIMTALEEYIFRIVRSREAQYEIYSSNAVFIKPRCRLKIEFSFLA